MNSDAVARKTALAALPGALPGTSTDANLEFSLAVGKSVLVVTGTGTSLGACDDGALQNSIYKGLFASVNAYISGLKISNVTTLDQYLTTLNATPFTALIGPNCAYLYWLYATNALKTGTALLTPGNIFAPATTLGTATIGAAGAVTFTGGASIPTVNVPATPLQGYAPALAIAATATVAVNGTESIHVTYNGQTSAGVPFTGHVGTLVVDSLALGVTTLSTAWTPAATGERVSAITAMVVTGSPTATAGAITIKTAIERVTS